MGTILFDYNGNSWTLLFGKIQYMFDEVNEVWVGGEAGRVGTTFY